MTEAYLKLFASEKFEVHSAGLEPGKLNPFAIAAMLEDGIDISNNETKSVFDLHQQKKSFEYVVTVCDPKASEMCPVFIGTHRKINWSFDDPSTFRGSDAEKLSLTRNVRDQIKEAVLSFIKEFDK